MEQCRGPSEDRGLGATGYTRSGLRYRPLLPSLSVEESEESVGDTESVVSRVSHISPPLLWDMDEMYGASKGPRRFSGALGTIELDDFIQEFDTWCDMQMLRNATLFTPFMAWKGLFQHLEGPPMDDYHEFRRAHAAEIEEWRRHWSPNYVSITFGGRSGQNVGAHGSSASTGIESDTETGPSTAGTSERVPPSFNPVSEFFSTLRRNY